MVQGHDLREPGEREVVQFMADTLNLEHQGVLMQLILNLTLVCTLLCVPKKLEFTKMFDT